MATLRLFLKIMCQNVWNDSTSAIYMPQVVNVDREVLWELLFYVKLHEDYLEHILCSTEEEKGFGNWGGINIDWIFILGYSLLWL